MVVSSSVTSVAAEVSALPFAEGNAEVVGCGVDGIAHIGDVPSARRCLLGTEEVETAESGMAVRGKV